MTKEHALNKTRKLWVFLRDNPHMSKREAYQELGMREDERLCPLCEHANLNCLFCLFIEFWAETTNGATKFPLCRNAGSPYEYWYKAKTDADKSKYASQMVDWCDKLLRKMLI